MGEGNTDRPSHDLDRLTVAQAAEVLGISQDAVRKRIARGTISNNRDDAGRVYVYLSPSETVHRTDQDDASKTVQDPYIRSLEDRIASLERQLNEANERDRENRRIIAGLTSRIPQLEAPQEASESRETAEEARKRFGAVAQKYPGTPWAKLADTLF